MVHCRTGFNLFGLQKDPMNRNHPLKINDMQSLWLLSIQKPPNFNILHLPKRLNSNQ